MNTRSYLGYIDLVFKLVHSSEAGILALRKLHTVRTLAKVLRVNAKNPHERIDRINLAMDRLTAAKIRQDPRVVEIAKANLARWKAQEGGELAPAHREWELALRFLTPMELADFIESETPKANRLRQSSPFAGVLTESERLAIIHSHEEIAA